MGETSELFEAVVAAFRERLTGALEEMCEARTALAFCDAERLLLTLAHELAAAMTEQVLQRVSDDDARTEEALAQVRQKAGARGIQMRDVGRRKTLIRTVGGQQIEVTTRYAVGKPRVGARRRREGRKAQECTRCWTSWALPVVLRRLCGFW